MKFAICNLLSPLRHLLNLVLRQARRHIQILGGSVPELPPRPAPAPATTSSSGSRGGSWRRWRALPGQAGDALQALPAEVADQAAVADLDVQGTCSTQGFRVSGLWHAFEFG